MIASLMLYAVAIAALVGVVAVLVEAHLAAHAWPRRGVWLGAMLLSIGAPTLIVWVGVSIGAPELHATTRFPSAAIDASLQGGRAVATLSSLREFVQPNASLDWPSYPKLDALLQSSWIGMSLSVVGIYLIGWLRLRRSARKWRTESIHDAYVHVSEHSGPAVFGFVKPQIVVPRWLLTESQDTRTAVIAHEREHIAGRDPLCLLVALLAIALMPWNPLLWWQLRRLRFAIEVDCDARVLRRDIDVSAYGETLLSIGQHHSRIPIGAMALTEAASQLERRIRIMTTETRRYSKTLVFVAVAMSAMCMATAAELSAMMPLKLAAASASSKQTEAGANPITLRLKDADIRDVMALLAQNGHREVYLSSRVAGKISVEFQDTPSDQAIDYLLRSQHLSMHEEGDRLYIDVASAPEGAQNPVYSGERMNLRFKDVDIRSVVRAIAQAANQNIVIAQGVKATVTVDMKDTPWDQALDTIVRDYGLVKEQRGNFLFIDLAPTTARESIYQSRLVRAEPPARDALFVDIDFDGAIYVSGAQIEGMDDLKQIFQSIGSETKQPEVRINVNRMAKYETVAQVLALAKESKVEKVEFAVLTKSGR